MFKKAFVILCCLIGGFYEAEACDACGAATNGLGIGLMTDYRSNFLRLSYSGAHFSSNLEYGHQNSIDVFSQMNISFRYSPKILPKWRFTGHLPYGYNRREEDGVQSNVQGLADMRFGFNYTILNRKMEEKKSALYAEAGLSLSLPTGKYDADLIYQNLPENFNIGSGSVGYIFQINSIVNVDKLGVLANLNYRLNADTPTGYHFGNQFTSQLTAFREFRMNDKFKLIPNIGTLYEHIFIDEYANGNNVPETGGKGVFFLSAINFKTQKWLAGASYFLPIDQYYSDGLVNAGGRLILHISFLFSSNKTKNKAGNTVSAPLK